MQSSKVQVTFGSETLYLKLTDDPDDFMNSICTAFKIKQFIAKVEMNNNLKLIFEFGNPNLIQKDEMLQIKQSGCKCIQILEIKDQSNQVNNYQFFEAFVNGCIIQCCTRKDCQLCSGNGQAIIQESDQPFINEVIKNKLNERLPEIHDIILKRDKKIITSPEDFLKYHLINKNQQFMTITPEQTYIQFIQDNNDILQDDKQYKVKIIEQTNFEGERGGEAVMQIKYMNDGSLNWPQKVQFVCIQGPFQIRQDIKSLMQQQTTNQEIKIHIPEILPNQYEFTCRFEYQNEYNKKIQFGPFIKLVLMVKEKNKLQNFDEQNRKLIPEIENQLLQMGYKNENFVKKMNAIFQNSTNKKLNLEGFMIEFWND